MTIDLTVPCENKLLIQSSRGTFYPVRIPAQHRQLKQYVSTKDPNIVYYASVYEVYALNICTRRRKLVKSLPWKPQCLDAAYGWIIVGGPDNGQCAFISIHEDDARRAAGQQNAEVDDLLPLDLNSESRRLANHDTYRIEQWAQASARRPPKYELQTHELGGSIVNSVAVHLLPSEQKGLEDEVVAVMTNNDSTVRIYSLTQSCLLQTLDFPTYMNHASMSPDGKLLLAVGDESRVFFCRRVSLPSAAVLGGLSSARYEWHEVCDPKISLADSLDACFTTAFSPSGHICAVASQSGVIAIYDTALIEDGMDGDAAVIHVLRASRPCVGRSYCGAVRSMSFSPAPWDLLAWAEDQGRVCVVDLRNAFQSRQTVELETDSTHLTRVEVEDYDTTSEQRQLEIERRFVERHREALEAQDHLAAVNHTADYVELAADRRRIEREALDAASQALRDNPHALTESERQMIDSIGLRRLQGSHIDSTDTLTTAPTGGNYNPSFGLPSPSSSSNLQSRTASIHEFMRQRNLERSRATDRSYQPRRRSSVVISNSNSHSNTTNTSSPHPSGLAPIGTATPTLSASPSRLPASSTDNGSPLPVALFNRDPWETISDAMGSANIPTDTIARIRSLQSRNLDRRMQASQAQQPTQQTITARADAVTARVDRARESNARALRQMRAAVGRPDFVYEEVDRDVLLRRLDQPRVSRPEEGVVTMGIGWSGDGRNLYVATEEGLLEYTVNVKGRKTFPSMSFL